MKVFICADIEGVGGVVEAAQLKPGATGYAEAARMMTNEVLAAIEGARQAGAEHFVIADAHGGARNIEIGRLPDCAEIVQGWPRALTMMAGVDLHDYAGAFLIGQHAGAHSERGVLAHTMSGRLRADIRANDISLSETQINGALAVHFGVPVLLGTGDDVYADMVGELFPSAQAVATKTACGVLSARSLPPSVCCDRIRQAAQRAMGQAGLGMAAPGPEIANLLDGPLPLEIAFKKRQAAEIVAFLPGAARADAYTVAMEVRDILELDRLVTFIAMYDPSGYTF